MSSHPGKRIHRLAHNLRANATPAEKKLWASLRESRLDGFQFRRQFPIGDFIVDFCCRSSRLVVELDGSQHGDDPACVNADAARTALISQRGYSVMRFWNQEIIDNLDGVLEQILAALKQPPPNLPLVRGRD